MDSIIKIADTQSSNLIGTGYMNRYYFDVIFDLKGDFVKVIYYLKPDIYSSIKKRLMIIYQK
jgi:hypothetical protein